MADLPSRITNPVFIRSTCWKDVGIKVECHLSPYLYVTCHVALRARRISTVHGTERAHSVLHKAGLR